MYAVRLLLMFCGRPSRWGASAAPWSLQKWLGTAPNGMSLSGKRLKSRRFQLISLDFKGPKGPDAVCHMLGSLPVLFGAFYYQASPSFFHKEARWPSEVVVMRSTSRR